MDELIAGFRKFRETRFRTESARFRRLVQRGQSPKALVLACCDSRVDPQMVFSAGPGDLFVVRNVANLVPPYQPTAEYHGTSAAIEFGVRGLGVRHIIVMGHSQCGGIHSLLTNGVEQGDFVGPWMAIAEEARTACAGHPPDEAQRMGEFEGIRISLRNLMTFPWIRERVEAGTLNLEGCLFDIMNGELLMLDHATGAFGPIPAGDRAAARAR
ncbi:carbonic anhydrase [Arenibaculum pallidiluteum]|uniref:carbonic anhydrase n=1 Tax=Arenibaculum pallidiluteum TaxID=2812559 RepID=UPI001A97290A|nr:carbonic anhydrase [Arenibaculum pallidiluteum]